MTQKSRIVGWVEQRETQHQSKEAKLKISGYSSLLLLPSSNQYLYFQNPRRIAATPMILLGYAVANPTYEKNTFQHCLVN